MPQKFEDGIDCNGQPIVNALIGSVDIETHHTRHEAGGADPINLTGLTGEAATPQPPKAHRASHEPGGSDALTVDAAAGVGSLRTLGTGAQQACAGNDPRLSDARTPTAHKTTHQAGGSDEISLAGLTGEAATPQPPKSHAASHQSGGADEISVAGLSGELADPQPPKAHKASHEPGGSDALTVDAPAGVGSLRTLGNGAQQACAGNDPRLSDARTPTAHHTTHESGGSDEINVTGLSGELADPQPPKSHASTHQNGGADEINVAGLSGELADPQPPKAHAASHETGGSDTLTHNNLNGRSAHPAHPAHAIENFVASVNADTTLDATHRTVLVDSSGGDVTITLPTAVGITGRIYEIKKVSSDTNVVIIDPNGAETVDGATDFRLAGQYNAVTVQSDGANWRVISQVFGNDYQSDVSAERSTTSSTSPQDKLTLTTPALRGVYRVSWHAVVDSGQANRGVDAQLYNVTDAVVVGVEQREWPQDTNERCQVGGYDLISFAGAAKTFKIQYRSHTGNTVGIQDARIELWRVK